MFNQNKFAHTAKLAVCVAMIASLSGCYLSIGGGGKKRKGDDDTNIVVTTGGQSAPPTIINNTIPTQAVPVHSTPTTQSGERSLQPINR